VRIGLLGGTFDPPHYGHLILATYVREQLKLDRVSFIPAGDPWRKAGRDISPAPIRLAMVRLAVADNAAFEVDDREVEREGPSYTLDTLREVRRDLEPGDELYFIVGEDALADLPHWHEPAAIAAEARIAVVPREGVALPDLPFGADRIDRLQMPYIGISATELRERRRRGLSLRYQTPPQVEAFIHENRLYTGQGAPAHQ
jgi:nicotinate-nucleotide adenylyltransferase